MRYYYKIHNIVFFNASLLFFLIRFLGEVFVNSERHKAVDDDYDDYNGDNDDDGCSFLSQLLEWVNGNITVSYSEWRYATEHFLAFPRLCTLNKYYSINYKTLAK